MKRKITSITLILFAAFLSLDAFCVDIKNEAEIKDNTIGLDPVLNTRGGEITGNVQPETKGNTAQQVRDIYNKKVKVGFKLGINNSGMTSEFFESENYEMYRRPGANFGFLLEFDISKYFSFQPELLYSLEGCILEGYTTLYDAQNDNIIIYEDVWSEHTFNLGYIKLPINAVFKYPLKNGSVYWGLGPYLAYAIHGTNNARYTKNGEDLTERVTNDSKVFRGKDKLFEPTDFGGNTMVGYEFNNGIFLTAGYSFSLQSIEDKDAGIDAKNNNISIHIGYKF